MSEPHFSFKTINKEISITIISETEKLEKTCVVALIWSTAATKIHYDPSRNFRVLNTSLFADLDLSQAKQYSSFCCSKLIFDYIAHLFCSYFSNGNPHNSHAIRVVGVTRSVTHLFHTFTRVYFFIELFKSSSVFLPITILILTSYTEHSESFRRCVPRGYSSLTSSSSAKIVYLQ